MADISPKELARLIAKMRESLEARGVCFDRRERAALFHAMESLAARFAPISSEWPGRGRDDPDQERLFFDLAIGDALPPDAIERLWRLHGSFVPSSAQITGRRNEAARMAKWIIKAPASCPDFILATLKHLAEGLLDFSEHKIPKSQRIDFTPARKAFALALRGAFRAHDCASPAKVAWEICARLWPDISPFPSLKLWRESLTEWEAEN